MNIIDYAFNKLFDLLPSSGLKLNIKQISQSTMSE